MWGKLSSYQGPHQLPESIAALFDAMPEEAMTLSQLPLVAWKQSALKADLSRPPSASATGQVFTLQNP